MRKLLVIPLFLVLTVAEDNQSLTGQEADHQDPFPIDSGLTEFGDTHLAAFGPQEGQTLEKDSSSPSTHIDDDRPHPHRVRQDFHPRRTSTESFPNYFEGEEPLISGGNNPVPDPHLVQEEPHHNGAERDKSHHHHHHHRHGSVETVRHNGLETPSEKEFTLEEDSFPRTETILNGVLFEHEAYTTVPELEPTVGTESGFEVVQEPVVLPVTEGKNRNQDPASQYAGLPKELMPILPGGGSRFEDLEREKLEKKKMSQTKGTDDEDTENSASHEAEGLYSSATTLCLSSIIFSLTPSFRLIV